jgi:hypothetical protein
MAKERLVINGYIVPGGYGGIAVRRACETVIANPGITQQDLLQEAVRFSGINLGTASWITSPGPKSPAALLWDRRKEGVFRCYPNEHTAAVGGSQEALIDEFIRNTTRLIRDVKFRPRPGDLVRVSQWGAEGEGIFLGYKLGHGTRFFGLRNTVEEWITERPAVMHDDRVYASVLLNGADRPSSVWNFGSIQPV